MIKLILILLLIHYSLFYIFKNRKKDNYLFCGIFGWFGKNPKKFNKDKFDKLGIYNVERGRTSCGISVDGDLFVGIDDQKLYTDFIKNRDITPHHFPYVLGHTRNASPGMPITIDNVHPFGFGTLKNSEIFEFIGVHNGTVYNSKDLAEKYKIETQESKTIINKHNVKQLETRNKIDSEILLEILYSTKNYKVLSEYNGTAALVFINLNEPDVVYVWKGASKSYTYINAAISEERPLFYFQETPNSLYISSIEDSLLTIGGIKDENTFTFNDNTIYKIKGGNVAKAEKIKISRIDALQKESYTNLKTYTPSTVGFNRRNAYQESANKFLNNKNCRISENLDLNIYDEKPAREFPEYGKRPYFYKLRFWRNGHPINGIYTWIMNYGYYYLDSNTKADALKEVHKLIGKSFKDGEFESRKIITTKDDFVPFTSDSDIIGNLHYFIEGAKLKNDLDYIIFKAEKEKFPNIPLSIHQLSHCSQHPVCRISKISPPNKNQNVIFEGKHFNGSIIPLGSEKRYVFKEGNLVQENVIEIGAYRMGFSPKKKDEKKKEATTTALTIVKGNQLKITPFINKLNSANSAYDSEESDYEESNIDDISEIFDLESLLEKIEEDVTEAVIIVETAIEDITESGLSDHVRIKLNLFYLNKIKEYFYKLTPSTKPINN